LKELPWSKIRAVVAPLVTAAIFLLIFRKVPFEKFTGALAGADYLHFWSALIPFSVLYFALDTVVLWAVVRWFHPARAPLLFSDLLPVRAVDYLISILNHKLSQGAMIVYLARQRQASLLELTSTIVFLDLLQKTHLVVWASAGMILVGSTLPRGLYLVPLAVLLGWTLFLLYMRGRLAFLGVWLAPKDWRLLRTFRIAPLRRYFQVLLLKAPLLLAAALAHSWAMKAFGIEIGALKLLATLPLIFLVGAMPVTIAHLGTTQAAWLFFHGEAASPPALLAYSLAAHLTFMLGNAALGLAFLPRAYRDLFGERRAAPAAA
jgi:hypothetical protein